MHQHINPHELISALVWECQLETIIELINATYGHVLQSPQDLLLWITVNIIFWHQNDFAVARSCKNSPNVISSVNKMFPELTLEHPRVESEMMACNDFRTTFKYWIEGLDLQWQITMEQPAALCSWMLILVANRIGESMHMTAVVLMRAFASKEHCRAYAMTWIFSPFFSEIKAPHTAC